VLEISGLPWLRRSALGTSAGEASQKQVFAGPENGDADRKPIVLVDTIGELGAWWGTAHIAFVGGSFGPRGGQNMIEPAAYGAAVCFGPNTRNFRDIVDSLLAANAALVVANGEQLDAFVERCLDEPAFAAELGERAERHVRSQLGATARTLSLLRNLGDRNQRTRSTRRAA
jgi:3-deoxy-D-manno-octulosonic-acid transferase